MILLNQPNGSLGKLIKNQQIDRDIGKIISQAYGLCCQRNLNDPRKVERYQAEALIHNHVPVEALLGVICYDQGIEKKLKDQVQAEGFDLKIHAIPEWYFS